MLAIEYQRRLDDYQDKVARDDADIRSVKVYQNLTPMIHHRPNVLSVFSEGLEKQLDPSVRVTLGGI